MRVLMPWNIHYSNAEVKSKSLNKKLNETSDSRKIRHLTSAFLRQVSRKGKQRQFFRCFIFEKGFISYKFVYN